jgi:hypothetical protein
MASDGLPHRMASLIRFVDNLASGIFLCEMLLKVIALGLAFSPESYLASGWNRFDCIIILAVLFAEEFPAVRALRVLRVLRPLRMASQIEELRITIDVLLKSLPGARDVLYVYFFFLSIFAILAVQLLAGALHACEHEPERLTTRAQCEARGYAWSNPVWGSFDNVFAAALVLIEVSSFEGWTTVLFASIDAVGADVAPQPEHSLGRALFFLIWIFVGAFVLLNLIAGVLVSTFNDIKAKQEGAGVVLTERQRDWVETMEQWLTLCPRKRLGCPENACRAAAFRLVSRDAFEPCILVLILFNTLLMALDGYGLSAAQTSTLTLLNYGCSGLFVLEAALKLLAYGAPGYFREAWNVFDFSIVLLTLAEWAILLAEISVGESAFNPTVMRLLRIVRVGRVLRTLRVVRSARGLVIMLSLLLLSLPALVNTLGVFLLVLLVYSLLAMSLFGQLARGEFITEDAHFCDFGHALYTMFRCSTGEDWNGIMHEAMQTPANGACSYEAGDCGSWLAIPFFLSYVVLTTYVVLKMLIALILENYVIAMKRDHNSLQPHHAEAFVKAWAEFDPEATGFIYVGDLSGVIKLLPPPLGLDPSQGPFKSASLAEVQRYALELDLHTDLDQATRRRRVRFSELLAVLVRDAYSDVLKDSDLMDSDAQPTALNGRSTLGLTWVDLGDQQPPSGREIENPALAMALLQGTLTFTQEAFDAFEVTGLRQDSWIAARWDPTTLERRYFKPDPDRPRPLRKAQTWGNVLPPANSRVGQRLYRRLSESKIIVFEEDDASSGMRRVRSAGADANSRTLMRTSLADEVICKAWSKRKSSVVARIDRRGSASPGTAHSGAATELL